MEPATKTRTPSRCREWERQRRNKFNEAIAKLGEVVKEIARGDNVTGQDVENVQLPKIEIVQKAIICLTNCAQEKTKMKAEMLALQVRLDGENIKKCNLKDVSTQVNLSMTKKNTNNKFMKLVMLQKSKRNALKEKPVLTPNATVKLKSAPKKLKPCAPSVISRLLPKLEDKKCPENNTIVVLPAAQYIFPQRPLLFPTVPPAIVLVDPNLQTLNKAPINRHNVDVTKTTMVNILPISAYSRPMSATKIKKNSVKLKKDVTKKPPKPSKLTAKVTEPASIKQIPEDKSEEKLQMKNGKQDKTNKEIKDHVEEVIHSDKSCTAVEKIVVSKDSILDKDKIITNNKETIDDTSKMCNKYSKSKEKESIETTKTKCKDQTVENNTSSTSSVTITNSSINTQSLEVSNKYNKATTEKVTSTLDKEKENKLPNILETTLCDTTVDAGNACLELAEELLADSPKTAAYLMSFPLVSGNRVDSPAEEQQSTLQINNKENNQRRNDAPLQSTSYFEKQSQNECKIKLNDKSQLPAPVTTKSNESHKYTGSSNNSKQVESKASNPTTVSIASNDNPFLNLTMPSLVSTTCNITDNNFGLDFDCNISKSIQNPSANYVSSSNNFFYKSDPFSSVKNTIYSTSSITSSHDFNSLGLYPCAMEKYTSKAKSDYSNVEENLMKIGSSRLTYDIDLGWSHKSFDFVNCTTTTNTFCKDNILTTVSAPYTTTYNPFNPDFHIPLVANANKKENVSTKSTTSFSDTITSFYSQPTNLWSEDVPFYTNNNVTKAMSTKHQNYLSLESIQTNTNIKPIEKHYDVKQNAETIVNSSMKPSNVTVEQQIPEKFTKKSPTKMHINWMTSETRPMENNCNPGPIVGKDNHKTPYTQISHATKKQDHNESYFPITMHNFVTQQPAQEEFHMWPSTRQVGPTEISIEPPPINLPTLVGDLALGPHDKKKNTDVVNRAVPHTQDIQNCGNFLSVTQLMNRSSDNMTSRYQVPTIEAPKTNTTKQISSTYFSNDINRKSMSSRLESQLPQPCYGFNDSKLVNSYDNIAQFSHNKSKTNKSDKSSKTQKSSYSAESLIRGGGCTQKIQDNSNAKFMMPSQKYNDFNAQDNSIAQVSHFPSMLDYSDNSYASQQFSGTTLYNSTTNTISNSFYSNFMPGSSNLMSSNYTSAPFSGEFLDYNQTDCNYTNHKYEDLKMRNNPTVYPQDKVPSNYKSSRRESAAKHKLECSKKDSSKKYQSKRTKLNTDVEEWNDPSHLLWQNKGQSKRHTNIMSDELTFPNYVGNQMPSQYQPEFFNSHLMPSNMQSVGHNVDRSLSFPATSRANFNLSTIFPEITMKVQ